MQPLIVQMCLQVGTTSLLENFVFWLYLQQRVQAVSQNLSNRCTEVHQISSPSCSYALDQKTKTGFASSFVERAFLISLQAHKHLL